MNVAFGGTVTKNINHGFVFGAEDIKIDIPADMIDSGIARLLGDGTTFSMLESHGDEVTTLGNGARLLGSSKRCVNEVVLVRDNILTMQCHPDLTPELMMEKIWPSISSKGLAEEGDRELIEEGMRHLDTEKFLDIIRKFMLG